MLSLHILHSDNKLWVSWGGVKPSTDSPCDGLWIHKWLIWLISSLLSVRGLESGAKAFRQMDIDYKITIFSWTLCSSLKIKWHVLIKFGSKLKTWNWGRNPIQHTEVLIFYELVRLLYGPWRHHQPSCKSSLLCQMVGPFWPATVHLQLFWALVLLGKLGNWTNNCAHIFSRRGEEKLSVVAVRAQDKQNVLKASETEQSCSCRERKLQLVETV